jgi:hypothetical protein
VRAFTGEDLNIRVFRRRRSRWRMAGIWDLIMEALAETHDGSVHLHQARSHSDLATRL